MKTACNLVTHNEKNMSPTYNRNEKCEVLDCWLIEAEVIFQMKGHLVKSSRIAKPECEKNYAINVKSF
jgi:hypothetical protein